MNAQTKPEQVALADTLLDTKTGKPVPLSDLVHVRFPGVPDHIGTLMTHDQGIDAIVSRKDHLQEDATMTESFECFPYDGAYQLDQVMTETFGFLPGTKTWFGTKAPPLVKVEIAFGVFVNVPWGRISVPNTSGATLETKAAMGGDGMLKFTIKANMVRKDESVITELCEKVRNRLKTHSIYRGNCIKISFSAADGSVLPMPVVTFMDAASVDPNQLVLSSDTADMVETNLMTVIKRFRDLIANGMSIKRAVMLTGDFGGGKTLIAATASYWAYKYGVTFVYPDKAADLGRAVAFCKQYQTATSMAVIFVEDIDRDTSGERDAKMDALFNTIDGIDSKQWNILVVMTTNNVKAIHAAMLRPGRGGDAIIDIKNPDATAVQKLLRNYGGEAINPDTDLTEVGKELAGNSPATITEVVKRAKLAEVRRSPEGTIIEELSAEALLEAAKTVRYATELLREQSKKVVELPSIDKALGALVARAGNGHYDDAAHTVQ